MGTTAMGCSTASKFLCPAWIGVCLALKPDFCDRHQLARGPIDVGLCRANHARVDHAQACRRQIDELVAPEASHRGFFASLFRTAVHPDPRIDVGYPCLTC